MPGFSANLGVLWTELPLTGRVRAAARAGFDAVEVHYPYDTPVSAPSRRWTSPEALLLGKGAKGRAVKTASDAPAEMPGAVRDRLAASRLSADRFRDLPIRDRGFLDLLVGRARAGGAAP